VAIGGAIAAAAGLAASEAVAAIVVRTPSLIAAVGQVVVRAAPGSASTAVIERVGTADKLLLFGGIAVATLVLGAAAGLLARRRAVAGASVFGLLGLVAVGCAASLPAVSVEGAALGALFAVAVAVVTLRLVLGALPADPAPPATALPPGAAVGRRRFLVVGSSAAAGTALVFTGAWGVRARRSAARDAVHLPDPAHGALTAGDDPLALAGASPLVTPNAAFYKIDEALVAPSIDLDSWRLRVTGMVDTPHELSFDELLAEPLVETYVTLSCVSNEVGGPLVGNALWRGVRLDQLLARAGVRSGATQVVGRSVDGFTVGFPTAVLDGRDALVAVGMNGEPLPVDHGFPARLVVPGLYGFVSATKWLTEIELTTWDAFDSYWTERGWSKEGPVKVQSRIDVPRDYSRVAPGSTVVAGVAWAPHRGIGAVEIRVDGGPWTPATIGRSLGDDAWRQWSILWEAAVGVHQIEVRATTSDGEVQTDVKHGPHPSGATGHHVAHVRVVA
jgi:DMSO/TMAO reductase YedYZ molybdopterin-dependent catalytic subunit